MGDMEKVNFSEYLRRHRRNLELTQREASELVDIPMRTYQSLEGDEGEPSFENLLKILTGFKVSLEQLLEMPVPQPKPPTPEEIDATVARQAREITRLQSQLDLVTKQLEMSQKSKNSDISEESVAASNEKPPKRYQPDPLVTNHIHDKNAEGQYHKDDTNFDSLILDLEAAATVLNDEQMREVVADLQETISDHLEIASKDESNISDSSSSPSKKKDSRE
jgi:transcriptional regulator with XRE-family HTH domain